MSSSDSSIISKQKEPMSMTTHRVLRRDKRFPPARYSPYTSGTNFTKEKQKEEAVQLGVELSVFVAEAMFLLSDDTRSMVWFGRWLCEIVGKEVYDGPVVGRLSCVFLNVFVTYIKPNNGVNRLDGMSIHSELIKMSSQHFSFGVKGLDRIVSILKNGGVVKPSGFEYYNQELKKLEETLRRSPKHVSEANGFARDAIKSNVLHLWLTLFQTTPKGINPNIRFNELEMYTTIMRINFTKEKQKEEAVRLGVELSLFVAEAMFLLSDDIRSMLLFCFLLFKYAGKSIVNGPVVGRVFLVIEYVFATYIKPKNGVYHDGGELIQWELFGMLGRDFGFGVKRLDRFIPILKNGGVVKPSCFEYYNQELKKLEEMLRSVKVVSEANRFAREATTVLSNILHLWKSLFETTPEVIIPKKRFLELFGPLLDETNKVVCCRRLASLLI